jgi:ribose-phosphate pyrophosphokinase
MKLDDITYIPYGELALIVLDSAKEFGKKVDEHLVRHRKTQPYYRCQADTYVIHAENIRFSNGEGKIVIKEPVRGKDVYILADIGNYGCTYTMFGHTCHMGPDEHFQDIMRTISAIAGNARRINVVMPLLYSSRQHKRKGRESLDCAVSLQQLIHMGVSNIFTVDAHDPRIENAIPLNGFENIYPTYDMIRAIFASEQSISAKKDNLLVISPDTGAMDRALYYADALGIDIGLFYKRRDFSKIVNGKNPIIDHVYMGSNLEGKDVLVVDDMIASGESILDIAYELKKRKARYIYIAVTFAFFTEGYDEIDKAYEKGVIDRIYTTNLTYLPQSCKEKEWLYEVDMSQTIATVINNMNYDLSLTPLFDTHIRLKNLKLFKE